MVIGPAGKLAECRAKAKINNNNSPAAAQQSIDISCRRGPQHYNSEPAAAACGGRMGQTDRRTPDRCIDPAPHTMRAVLIIAVVVDKVLLPRNCLRIICCLDTRLKVGPLQGNLFTRRQK